MNKFRKIHNNNKRFINDTSLAHKNKLNLENFQSYFGNLRFTLSHGHKIVNFLNLNLRFSDSKIT